MALLSPHHTEDVVRKFEKISAWHDTMSEIPHIKKYDEFMKELISKYSLQERH